MFRSRVRFKFSRIQITSKVFETFVDLIDEKNLCLNSITSIVLVKFT